VLFNNCDSEEILGEAERYVPHHPTSKHQCTRLGSVPI